MWNSINQILTNIDNFVWGVPLMVIILFGGILLTVRLGLLQLRKLPLALKWMVKNEEEAEGEITSFAALCTALSATIGTGNIVGIQSEIILSGEKAYLVTDDFMHIMSCNHAAKVCLDDILGGAADGLDGSRPCSWLPFLLGSELGHAENRVQTRVIRDYIFKIYTYDQRYSNGIVDRYHWITIARAEQPAAAGKNSVNISIFSTILMDPIGERKSWAITE